MSNFRNNGFNLTKRNPEIWENSDQFQPERFLNENNEIIMPKADALLTFGLGRRRCLGENLARMKTLAIRITSSIVASVNGSFPRSLRVGFRLPITLSISA
jgi:hypothetical protein